MGENQDTIDRRAAETALAFGSLIRSRRKALNMRQDDLALATGVGRRFLIDLEAGKSSCQLGRSLLVADALGLRVPDFLSSTVPAQCRRRRGVGWRAYPYTLSSGLSAPFMLIGVVPVSPMLLAGSHCEARFRSR